jgi:exopolysaccharide biosynthesis polyprenyl glycosylphosphotransferase
MLPARLIPGMRPGSAAQRHKISSAILNRQLPGSDSFDELLPTRAPRLGQLISEALLPALGRSSQRLGLSAQILADLVLIAFGFTLIRSLELVSCPTRFGFVRSSPATPSGISLLVLYAPIFILLGYSERLYHAEIARMPRQQMLVLAKTVAWSTILLSAGLATLGSTRLSIAKLAAAAPLSFLIMFAYRCLHRRVLTQDAAKANRARNVLIVGAGELGRRLGNSLEQDRTGKRILRGYLDEDRIGDDSVLGSVDDLASVARREFVDEIILAIPQHTGLARKAIWQARRNRIDVKLVPELFGADPAEVTLEKFGDTTVLNLWEEPFPVFGLLLKRTTDVLLSATALLFSCPLLAAIALLIKLDSHGPVLYRAPRLGLKGRRFLCCKFRTMVAHADQLKEKLRARNERQGAIFKISDDPRITRVGRILRRYSLDELPQLWNILRGEMSLVGPRPHPLDDVERYQLEDFQRLEVTPGLTGLWQVTARRDPSFERSMALDREYIGHWSLGMDFRILCKTLGAVLRGEGA